MSKYIRNYQSIADYNADTRPSDGSSVSKIAKDVKCDGINVVKDFVQGAVSRGDHVVFDKNDNRIKCIQAGTFRPTMLPSNFVDGKSIFVCNIDGQPFLLGVDALASTPWAQYGRFVLKDFDLANGGSASVKVQQSGGSGSVLSFSWNAGSTINDVLTAYQSAVDAIAGYYKTYSSATADSASGEIRIKAWYGPTEATSGCTLVKGKCIDVNGDEVEFNPSYGALANITANQLTEIGYNAMNMMGKDDGLKFGAKQYAVYISTYASATTYGSETEAFMNKATFDALEDSPTDTLGLWVKYGGDYSKYAAVCAELRRSNPDVRLKTCSTLRTGKDATRILASIGQYDFDGTILDAFPIMANANRYGISTQGVTTGFEPGNWHLLGVVECLKALHEVRRINADPIDWLNAAITEAGGTLMNQNTSYAICGAHGAGNQLFVYGTSGGYGGYTRIYGYAGRVALALEYNH